MDWTTPRLTLRARWQPAKCYCGHKDGYNTRGTPANFVGLIQGEKSKSTHITPHMQDYKRLDGTCARLSYQQAASVTLNAMFIVEASLKVTCGLVPAAT